MSGLAWQHLSADDVFTLSPEKKRSKESRKFGFLLYEAFYTPIFFFKAVYIQLIVLGLMFVWGTGIFVYYDRLPILPAFLGSVSTITTIGLYVPNNGNFKGMAPGEAVLLIIMIIVSVGAGASIVQSTVQAIAGGTFAKGEAEKKLISKLKNHVIVFGYTHLGRYVVDKLEGLNLDYVVLTRDPNLYQQLIKEDVFAVLEYQTQPISALKAAGIERASIVVVSHDADADNMLVILSAKKLRPDIRIISVVHDTSLIDTAKNAGADVVIPSSVTVGHMLALSAVTKNLVGVVFSEKAGTKEIAEFSVFKTSPLIGKELSEVSKLATVIGVIRGGDLIQNIFQSGFRIEKDDTVLVFGDPVNLLALEERAKAV